MSFSDVLSTYPHQHPDYPGLIFSGPESIDKLRYNVSVQADIWWETDFDGTLSVIGEDGLTGTTWGAARPLMTKSGRDLHMDSFTTHIDDEDSGHLTPASSESWQTNGMDSLIGANLGLVNDALLEGIQFKSSALQTLRYCLRRGIPTDVKSTFVTQSLDWILKQCDIDGVRVNANRVVVDESNMIVDYLRYMMVTSTNKQDFGRVPPAEGDNALVVVTGDNLHDAGMTAASADKSLRIRADGDLGAMYQRHDALSVVKFVGRSFECDFDAVTIPSSFNPVFGVFRALGARYPVARTGRRAA